MQNNEINFYDFIVITKVKFKKTCSLPDYMLNLVKRLIHNRLGTQKMAIDKWGVLVPASDLELPPEVAETPLYLSLLQHHINAVFYNREADPLSFFGTLGSIDKILPRAAAVDYLNNGNGADVHEIGPGNFNFATAFVDEAQLSIDDLVYRTHDFSDSSFVHAQQRLAPYGSKIVFDKTSFSEFSRTVTDDPLYVILVEVLDDTVTEFYTRYDGLESILLVRPKMDGHLKFPTRSLAGKMLADMGDSSLATQKMADADTPNREYTAQEIIALMQEWDWNTLGKIHPNFLRYIEYDEQVLGQFPLESALRTYGKKMSGDSNKFQQVIASYFRAQLDEVPEGYVISIPIAGLHLLWELKDRKKTTLHFFDYGYDNPTEYANHFSTYNGQITASVNFGLLKSTALWPGYDVQLETNREFIRRTLGEDTFFLGYLQEMFEHSGIPDATLKELALQGLQDKVMELSPDSDCTADNILGHRIRRSDYDAFMQKMKAEGILKPNVEVSEGSYHLTVHKS